MNLQEELQLEIEFRTRNMRGADLDAMIQAVVAGCEKLGKGERFSDESETLRFMQNYVVVRDMAHLSLFAEQMQKAYGITLQIEDRLQEKYGITPHQLNECKNLYAKIEQSTKEFRQEPTLFHSSANVFRREEFARLFEKFAPSSPSNRPSMN